MKSQIRIDLLEVIDSDMAWRCYGHDWMPKDHYKVGSQHPSLYFGKNCYCIWNAKINRSEYLFNLAFKKIGTFSCRIKHSSIDPYGDVLLPGAITFKRSVDHSGLIHEIPTGFTLYAHGETDKPMTNDQKQEFKDEFMIATPLTNGESLYGWVKNHTPHICFDLDVGIYVHEFEPWVQHHEFKCTKCGLIKHVGI